MFGSAGGAPTDLGFVNFSGFVYANTSIETTAPPKFGEANVIRARVANLGPNDATNVVVKFKIDYISAASWSFYDVGDIVIPLIPSGGEEWAEIDWTPQHADHQCLKAEIAYGPDTNSSNDRAQRNITVAQSPVYFRVENLVSADPIVVDFVADFEDPALEWDVQITPPFVELDPGEFAIIEALPLIPDGTPDGVQQIIYISSYYNDCMLLGGVGVIATMKDCNDNGRDDWFDIIEGTSQDEDGDHIPDECEAYLVGDLNCDGVVNFFDIDAFVLAITDPAGYAADYPDCDLLAGDCNGDGVVNFFDIDCFVELVIGM